MSQTGQPVAAAPVLLETREGSIVTLAMNRPERLNALDNTLSTALNEAMSRIATDPTIHVVILTGAGRAFCAGGDLAVIGKGRAGGDATELAPILRSGMQVVLKMRTMPQPVIAAVVRYSILALAVVAALGNLGVQTASLLAVLGAAGLAWRRQPFA